MKKRELVAKIRGEFSDLKFKSAKHNVEGWDHYVLILDERYVFRFPRKAQYAQVLKSEIPLMGYLREKIKLQIPDYEFVAKDKNFAGYKLIRGIQMEKEIFSKLSDSVKHTVALQLAQFFTALHKVPLSVARKFGVGESNKQKEYQEILTKSRKFIFPKVSGIDRQLIEDYFMELKKVRPFRKVLIHWDVYPSHILLATNRKKLAGIIDFADRSIEDPALDFCELWVYGRKFVEDVYKNYQGPKDPNFLNRTILYYKRMPIWMMLSTFEGERGNFKKNYKFFKEIFRNKNYFK
jgi:aminoglycoside 2''-phosphotransferase